jgi:hypothetical protein
MALGFSQKKQFGPSGLADVKINTKSVRIVYKESGDVYELESDKWPIKERPSGEYRVTLSKPGDKVIGISPIPGTYLVTFKDFGNRLDGIAQPKIQRGGVRQGKNGKYIAPDKMVFHANLLVESNDRFNGLTILSILAYGFEPLSGTPFATVNVESKRDLERIETFMRLTGYDFNKDIPYAPNVLPWLEEELKRAKKTFMVTTNADGFIDSMAEVPAALLKPAKKSKK